MYRAIIMIVVLSMCILPAIQAQAESDSSAAVNNKVAPPTIAITSVDVNDTILKLSYDIRNDSGNDVWILVGFGKTGVSAEAFMDKDDRTVLIRRRLDVAFGGGGEIAYGRYVLLRAGQTQREAITLATPVNPEYGFVDRPLRQARGLEYATRLAIEIGYYVGDLPGMIRDILEQADKIGSKPKNHDDNIIGYYFRGSLYFNKLSEALLRQRDEEVLLPYTYQWFKAEKVLRTMVDDLRIPYKEKEDQLIRGYSLDIPLCTRVESQYQPSILEYFFPYAGQQSLLNPAEKQYLQSKNVIVVKGQEDLNAFVNEINKGVPTSGIVRERSMAQVVCYRDDERLTSFPIYNDDCVVTDARDRFTYDEGFQSLRMLTPQIQPLELRIKCAANLRNLWNRLRLYYKASGRIEILYPAPTEWCDAMARAYKSIIIDEGIGMGEIDTMRAYICPGSGQGKCHYAMNPNCKLDSPPDMVLLFETKGGWNQHGGPELFTFDNHDPKGGCVLLNDGTVKFIRTKEELQQLRWK
jgi:hypothetical protein